MEGSNELLAKLEKYQGKWFSSVIEAIKPESLIPVVNHGDCWNNNMMFASGNDGEDLKVVFYDMQVSN